MLKRLLIYAGVIVLILAKMAWRAHERSERESAEIRNRFTPALNSMSASALENSEWAYSGPLGKLTLRFEPAGQLIVVSDGAESSGRWRIDDVMLMVYFPGSAEPHQGIFRKSTNALDGMSPTGLQPKTWKATRIE